jgi:putative transposase
LQDAATPPAKSLREQLDRFRAFRRLYNEERPHQALGNATPAEHYQASPRRWDGVLREPDYPVDQDVRRVRSNGEIKWRGNLVYINCALAGEPVGLAENAAGWTVSFGPIALGVIAHGGDRLRKPKPASCGPCGQHCALPTGSTASAAAARCPQGPPPLQQQHQS